jgi:hypothetical protein
MNGTDFTQLAGDGKARSSSDYEVSNHYNDRYERIDGPATSDEAGATYCLNHVHRALQGISVINTILTNDSYSSDSGREPLDNYMTGGLHSAVQALAEMAIDKIEFYADRKELIERRVAKNQVVNDVVGAVQAIGACISDVERAAAKDVRDGSSAIWGALTDIKRAAQYLDGSVERVTREVHLA